MEFIATTRRHSDSALLRARVYRLQAIMRNRGGVIESACIIYDFARANCPGGLNPARDIPLDFTWIAARCVTVSRCDEKRTIVSQPLSCTINDPKVYDLSPATSQTSSRTIRISTASYARMPRGFVKRSSLLFVRGPRDLHCVVVNFGGFRVARTGTSGCGFSWKGSKVATSAERPQIYA